MVVLFVLPLFVESYLMHLMLLIFFYSYLSCSWNILGGFVGQASIGHAVFFGIGAYTSSFLFVKYGLSPWIGMFAGGVISALISTPMGIFMFRYRLRGVYFSMVTISFAEIARIISSQLRFIGGNEGLLIPLRGSSIWFYQFENKQPFYYIALVMMLIILWICHLIRKSKYFYYFSAIRANEEASAAIGVNTRKYKLIAFVISAFFFSLGGTFYAQYYMFVEPTTVFGIMVSVDPMLRSIFGGTASLFGPVLGSFAMTPLAELIRLTVGSGKSGVHLLIYGIILIIMCIQMPNGILPYLSRALRSKVKGV